MSLSTNVATQSWWSNSEVLDICWRVYDQIYFAGPTGLCGFVYWKSNKDFHMSHMCSETAAGWGSEDVFLYMHAAISEKQPLCKHTINRCTNTNADIYIRETETAAKVDGSREVGVLEVTPLLLEFKRTTKRLGWLWFEPGFAYSQVDKAFTWGSTSLLPGWTQNPAWPRPSRTGFAHSCVKTTLVPPPPLLNSTITTLHLSAPTVRTPPPTSLSAGAFISLEQI